MNPARTSDEPVFLLFPTGSVEPLESATSPNVPPPTLRPRHPPIPVRPRNSGTSDKAGTWCPANFGTRCNAPRVPHVHRLPLRPTAVHGHGRRSHSLDLSDVRCITTRRCSSPAPTPSHRRGPPHRPRDTTSPLCHPPFTPLPTASRCVRICTTHPSAALPRATPPSALHAHGVPHAALHDAPISVWPPPSTPSAYPRWLRHSHPRAAHLCTLRTIRASHVPRLGARCLRSHLSSTGTLARSTVTIVHRRPLSSWDLIGPHIPPYRILYC
ncbi:hypothetical protein B0H14DRAFT_2909653, partial [Mycena olivaceomarginata]